ncbi:phage protease [Mycolicibacterium sp. PDY-3]|uniref:phage protease n=1 Tax=Mycolicibacterium sp. PDY-3 TaxID=3376069 RepID=UPI0037A5FBFC
MSNIHGLVTKVSIKADAQGNVPTQIELLRIGEWHTLWHGDFEITIADLHEYAANFAKGVGLVEGSGKAPVNYAHEEWDKAAGWMTGLSVDENRNALVASVEWTPEGERAIKDGEWAFISPEFNPRDSYPYYDPEAPEDENGLPKFIQNVLTGAALTNIPLFKKLKPIMASRVPSKRAKKADVTSGDGKNHNQGEPMKLEDILAKQVSERSDEEKAFLSDNAADLTDEQKTQVETEAADAQAAADKEAADKAAADQAAKDKADADAKAAEEAAKVEASTRGAVSIKASELEALKASAARADALAAEIDRNKATATVKASIKAGQVKSGEEKTWTDFLVGLKADQRGVAEKLLASLPVNEELGKELGDKGKPVEASAQEELNVKASAVAKESSISFSAALKEVLASDKELRERVDAERNQSN